MTVETFAKVLILIEQSRSFRFTPEEQKTWWALLEPLEDEAAMEATIEAVRMIEGRIVPAHIWNRAKAIMADRPVDLPMLDEPSPSEESWERGQALLREAAKKIGKWPKH